MRVRTYPIAAVLVLTGFLSTAGAAPKYWVGSSPNPTPNGDWDLVTPNWNDAADGTGSAVTWSDLDTAVFSAGGGATGAYNINVVGTQIVGNLPTDGIIFEDGNATLSGGTLDFFGIMQVDPGATGTINSTITAASGLTKTGTGKLTLGGDNTTTFNGTINVNVGTLAVTHSGVFGSVGTANTTNATVVSSGATLELADNVNATDRVFVNGTGVSGVGAIHKTGPGNTTITGGISFSSAGSVLVDAGGTLTLGGLTSQAIFASGVPTFGGDGNIVTTATVTGVTANLNIAVAAHQPIKTGAGTMTLVGISSNTEGWKVNGGVLSIGSDGTTVTTVSYNLGRYPAAFDANHIILDGGTLRNTNPLNAGNIVSPNRGIQLGPNGGTLDYTSSGAGAVSLYSSGDTGPALGTGGIIGLTSGTTEATLTKRGTGEVRVQGTGTASYAFTQLVVKQGLYRLGSVSFTGAGDILGQRSTETGFGAAPAAEKVDAIVLDGGTIGASLNLTLNANRGITVGPSGGGFTGSSGATITVPGPLSGSGKLSINGSSPTASAGGVTLTNANNVNTFTGAVEANLSTFRLNTSLKATNFSGNFSGTTAADVNLAGASVEFTVGSDGTSTSFPGRVLGAGTFTKVGGGTLTLNTVGTNEWTNTGGININGGSIKLGTSASGFASTVTVSIAASAALDLNGAVTLANPNGIGDNFGGLDGAGLVINHDKNPANTGSHLNLGGTGAYIFSGTINGAPDLMNPGSYLPGIGKVVKSGAGTQTFSGANNYSGGTEISAGTLTVDGAAGTLGTGNVTISGGILQLSTGVANAIANTAAVTMTGGIVDLGLGINEAIASLTLGGILQPGGTYGSSASAAMFQNDAYFTGLGILNVPSLSVPGDYNNDGSVNAADYVVWRKNPTVVGGGDPIGYNTWRQNFGNPPGSGSGGTLGGSNVPEPTALVLLLAGMAGLASGRRRSC